MYKHQNFSTLATIYLYFQILQLPAETLTNSSIAHPLLLKQSYYYTIALVTRLSLDLVKLQNIEKAFLLFERKANKESGLMIEKTSVMFKQKKINNQD